MHFDSSLVLVLVSVAAIAALVAYSVRKLLGSREPAHRKLLKQIEFLRKLRAEKPAKMQVLRTERPNHAKGLPARYEVSFIVGDTRYFTEAVHGPVRSVHNTAKEALAAKFTRMITTSRASFTEEPQFLDNPVRFA